MSGESGWLYFLGLDISSAPVESLGIEAFFVRTPHWSCFKLNDAQSCNYYIPVARYSYRSREC